MKRPKKILLLCLLVGFIFLLPKPTFAQSEDLKSLMKNYYYYRHLYSQRAGNNYWGWALKAVFLDPAVNLGSSLLNVKEFITIFKWGRLQEDIKAIRTEFSQATQKGLDQTAAICAVGALTSKIHSPDPVSPLLLGGLYTECIKLKAQDYYQLTLTKLREVDPGYCLINVTLEQFNSGKKKRNLANFPMTKNTASKR